MYVDRSSFVSRVPGKYRALITFRVATLPKMETASFNKMVLMTVNQVACIILTCLILKLFYSVVFDEKGGIVYCLAAISPNYV